MQLLCLILLALAACILGMLLERMLMRLRFWHLLRSFQEQAAKGELTGIKALEQVWEMLQ